MNAEDLEKQIFKITGRAVLEYNPNPGFVSFKNMGNPAARSSVKKLIEAGYDANISLLDKQIVIINLK